MTNMHITKVFYEKKFDLNKRTHIEKFEENDFMQS